MRLGQVASPPRRREQQSTNNPSYHPAEHPQVCFFLKVGWCETWSGLGVVGRCWGTFAWTGGAELCVLRFHSLNHISQVLREYAPKYDEVQEIQSPEVRFLLSFTLNLRSTFHCFSSRDRVDCPPTHPTPLPPSHTARQGTHQSGVFVAQGHAGGGGGAGTTGTEPSSRTVGGQGSGGQQQAAAER